MLFLVPGNAFGWLLPAGSIGAAVTLLIIMIAAGRGGSSHILHVTGGTGVKYRIHQAFNDVAGEW